MTGQLKLKRVLGFTSTGRNSFICQPNTGNLIYIAGCVVVIVNPRLKTQNHLVSSSNKQSITVLATTDDGRFLAAANCGQVSTIQIWDLTTRSLMTEFAGHKVEVSCMEFSTDGQYLVSIGGQQDMSLSLWDWRRATRLASHKLSTRVRAVSFAADGSYFVTVGDCNVNYWLINDGCSPKDSGPAQEDSSSFSISCKSANLGEQRKKNFCDVKCGRGPMAESTYCVTRDGILCELNNRRLLHKWVDLRTSGANCLALGDYLMVIGCDNGVARCFNTTELRFLRNLPRPQSLVDVAVRQNKQRRKDLLMQQKLSNEHAMIQHAPSYASITGLGLEESLSSVSCMYNDRSIYTWDLSNSQEVSKSYSVVYHSSCIWGIDTCLPTSLMTESLLPPGGFITCSSDDTLRVWSPNVFSSKRLVKQQQQQNQTSLTQIPAEHQNNDITLDSGELIHLLFNDSSRFGRGKKEEDEANGDEANDSKFYDSSEGLRCLRVSPCGSQVAVGSRSGKINVWDFSPSVAKASGSKIIPVGVATIMAHDAEVLCMEYSSPKHYSGYFFFASASRDKLIHIFDAADHYTHLQTVDDHQSSITALRFLNNRATDRLQLISCGADQRIIFSYGCIEEDNTVTFRLDQIIEGKNTFYDMELDSESSCLMTACQDRQIRLFNVAQVRYQSSFTGCATNCEGGTLIKIALDPTCTFLATSCTDKSISIYDYQRGECIACITSGLSDLITDLKFTNDGRHLIGCSGDGCIFIWKSPAEIANALLSGQSGGLNIAQLSLSSCSLGSLNRPAPVPAKGEPQEIAPDPQSTSRYQVQTGSGKGQSHNFLVPRASDSSDDGSPIGGSSNEDSGGGGLTLKGSRLSSAKVKLFQSRENLERIVMREKFLNEALDIKPPPPRARVVGGTGTGSHQRPAKSSLLSAFSSKDDKGAMSDKQTMNTLSRDSSSDDEDDDNNGRLNQLGRPSTPPKPSPHRQIRRAANGQQQPPAELKQPTGSGGRKLVAGGTREGAVQPQFMIESRDLKPKELEPEINEARDDCVTNCGDLTKTNNIVRDKDNTISNNNNNKAQVTTISSSAAALLSHAPHGQSNYDLGFGEIEGQGKGVGVGGASRRLDLLSELDPSKVALSKELCNRVADELQSVSKFATRLHQRLQHEAQKERISTPLGSSQVSGTSAAQQLAQTLAKSVQNSIDILSIVEGTPQSRVGQTSSRFHTQRFPSQLDLSCGGSSSMARRRSQSQLRHPPAKQQDNSSSSTQKFAADDSRAGGGSSNQSTGHQQQSTRSSQLNLDQVLEAYSDRLFRMVQERMVEQQQKQTTTTSNTNTHANNDSRAATRSAATMPRPIGQNGKSKSIAATKDKDNR